MIPFRFNRRTIPGNRVYFAREGGDPTKLSDRIKVYDSMGNEIFNPVPADEYGRTPQVFTEQPHTFAVYEGPFMRLTNG